MTIMENGRRTREQIEAAARAEIGNGPLPSKTSLAKALKTHYTIASEILEKLATERRREAARRHKQRRMEGAKQGPPRRVAQVVLHRPAPPCTTPDQSTAPVVVDAVPVDPPAALSEEVVQVGRRPVTWPILVLTMPAFVAIWGGWVDMGRLTGFGVVHPFPGIPGLDHVAVNLAITLPVSLETYAAYALYVWLSGWVPAAARRFAKRSAFGSLALGALGQIAYHLMAAGGMQRAPWWITTAVACLPVAVLGMGAALRHLVNAEGIN